MSEPVKAGDRCEVINALGGVKSPNLGLTVTVASFQGEHSRLGRIWRCEGKDVSQLDDAGNYFLAGWAEFPATWLRKLPPPEPHAANDEHKNEIAA